jgi:hypothetical protein
MQIGFNVSRIDFITRTALSAGFRFHRPHKRKHNGYERGMSIQNETLRVNNVVLMCVGLETSI